MKNLVAAPDYVSAAFREFGTQPDNHPVMLELETHLIQYVTSKQSSLAVLPIVSGVSAVHLHFEKKKRVFELIITFSESETELLLHSLMVVAVPLALAA